MEVDMVPETLVYFDRMSSLMAPEDFIELKGLLRVMYGKLF
jgi:hypothetical protein